MPWLLFAIAGLTVFVFPRRVLARGRNAGVVAHGGVSSPFGPRGPEGVHAGIDIAAAEGTEIRAARDGIVRDVAPDGERTGYGNAVIIEHDGHEYTLYAHMKDFGPGISIGKILQAGDVVGYVGNTQTPKTKIMAPHLHLEVLKGPIAIWKDKLVVNPDSPKRLDPQQWLRRHGRPVSG